MSCNNKLTLRQALEIQAGHLNHYGLQLTVEQERELRRRIEARTTSKVSGITDSDPLPIQLINRMVPRGGAIEAEVKRIRDEGQLREVMQKSMQATVDYINGN